jgi:hypothetical protein
MVYADLRFGGMLRGQFGWQTEPGQVIVRYGIPLAESTFTTDRDAYHIFSYQEFGFRFMDLAKAGKLTFFSPKVSGAPSFEAIRQAWNDDTIRAAERFRENPQISRFDASERQTSFDYLLTYFKGDLGSSTEVIATIELPAQAVTSETVTTGVFVLKDGSLSKSIQSIRPSSRSRIVNHAIGTRSGAATASIEFDAGEGLPVGFKSVNFEVPSFEGELAVSSLVSAKLIEEIETDAEDLSPDGFIRNNHWVSASIDGKFGLKDPLYVFFEVYNLSQSQSQDYEYTVEAFLIDNKKRRSTEKVIQRVRRRRSSRGVAVSFQRLSSRPDDYVYLLMDTGTAKTGDYVVVVRITDNETGNQVFEAVSVELR